MWVKGWLAVFALIILTFYSYYFIQILRGRPERFEGLLVEGMAMESGDEPGRSRLLLVGIMVGLSLVLEGGYFVLAWIVLNIPLYRVLTGVFIVFEIWHGIKVIPVIRGLAGRAEFGPDFLNWRIERLSARFFVTHALITLGLVLTV